jgi:hypothetical protein
MIEALARMLGIRRDQVPDALESERCARATLNRRGFLMAGATAAASLVAGKAFGWGGFESPYEFRLRSYANLWFAQPANIFVNAFDYVDLCNELCLDASWVDLSPQDEPSDEADDDDG